ncbi:MAG TPA: carboxymuconolactone decarboxylase family protein [Ignavibacteria bacterium]|nr:carboxymuconolactone decarboxylase family protein [Ignavibacteria bacterium]
MQKIDEGIIEALRTGEPIKDEKLEALRKFTQTVVERRGWLEENDIEEFLSAGYNKAQLLEVIVGVVQKTLSNYINHIVQTPLDAAFEPNKWEKVQV